MNKSKEFTNHNITSDANDHKTELIPDAFGNTMEDYDRWGTPHGMTKTVRVTPENRKAAAAINVQRAAAKKKATKKREKTIKLEELLGGLTAEQSRELSAQMNSCFPDKKTDKKNGINPQSGQQEADK